MKELVFQNSNGSDVTTSLIVAEVFGKNHKDVLRDIEKLSCSEDFRVRNFAHTPYTHPQNGQVYHYYEMTKDGFSFLVMGYTGAKAGEFKEKFINEFNKREMMLKDDDYILMRSQQILQKRVELAEQKIMMLESENRKQAEQIEADAPRVLFSKAVETAKRSCLVAELAKVLQQNGINMGQNRLFKYMRNKGYLCSKGQYYNQPTQKAMEQGLFEIKQTTINKPDGSVIVKTTTKVTGKGQVYFVDKILKEEHGII